MIYPITFPLTLEEAQIIEISLRGDYFTIGLRRPMLKELGRILLDEESGIITLLGEEDVWFLRDNIDPNVTIGGLSGLDLITRVYGIILGYKITDLPGEPGDANKNEAEDKNKDSPKGRPNEKIESRPTMPEPEGTDS